MTPFTYGMIDMSQSAVAARQAHEKCNSAREVAISSYLVAHAGDVDQAQVRLDADQAGQRAYWATHNTLKAA